MLFKEVLGQEKTKKLLVHSVREGRVPHAQLFLGSKGSGNLALALAFAQYVACTNKQGDDSCGECASCVKHQKFAHPDLHFVFPVATTSDVKSKPISKNFLARVDILYTHGSKFGQIYQTFERLIVTLQALSHFLAKDSPR